MGNIAPKVLPDDDMPGSAVAFVKLFFDLCGDVLLDGVLVDGGRCDVDAFLLHLLYHVDIFDDGFWATDAAVLSGARAGVGGLCGGCGVNHREGCGADEGVNEGRSETGSGLKYDLPCGFGEGVERVDGRQNGNTWGLMLFAHCPFRFGTPASRRTDAHAVPTRLSRRLPIGSAVSRPLNVRMPHVCKRDADASDDGLVVDRANLPWRHEVIQWRWTEPAPRAPHLRRNAFQVRVRKSSSS